MTSVNRSQSTVVRILGAVVALIAVIGYLCYLFVRWYASQPSDSISTAIVIVVGAVAVGWKLYPHVIAGDTRNEI